MSIAIFNTVNYKTTEDEDTKDGEGIIETYSAEKGDYKRLAFIFGAKGSPAYNVTFGETGRDIVIAMNYTHADAQLAAVDWVTMRHISTRRIH